MVSRHTSQDLLLYRNDETITKTVLVDKIASGMMDTAAMPYIAPIFQSLLGFIKLFATSFDQPQLTCFLFF